MDFKEAIKTRHTVRKFINKPILEDLIKLLNERIEKNNKEYNLNMKLVIDNTSGISKTTKLVFAKGVNNYIILAGEDTKDLDEKLGYCGTDLILYAQTLGLNTWWIGGMVNTNEALKLINTPNNKVRSVIVIGYGENDGVPHKSKKASEISKYNGEAPLWFINGVEALLYAPTAMNRQAYMVKGEENKVSISYKMGPFSKVDLGIGKYHFEVGAGKENFEWVDKL